MQGINQYNIERYKGLMIVAAVQHKQARAEVFAATERMEGARRAVKAYARKLQELGLSTEEIDELVNCIPDKPIDFTGFTSREQCYFDRKDEETA